MTRNTLIQLLADVREDGRPLGWHADRIRKLIEHGEPVAWGVFENGVFQFADYSENQAHGMAADITDFPDCRGLVTVVPLYAAPVPSTPTSSEEE